MKFIVSIVLCLSGIRLAPHIVVLMLSPNRAVIGKDLDRWGQVMSAKQPRTWSRRIALFVRLMTFNPEYRNLFYHRTGLIGLPLSLICRPMPTLYIHTRKIGAGLFIQHGFSTIIAAAEIGENCWINQQVTLGYSNASDCPILQSDVTVSAGAKVIGKVTIGSNVKIGANAVVVKNVPANVTVVGVPAYIVRKDGIKTRLPL
jgi:serine O-acetyltransferase